MIDANVISKINGQLKQIDHCLYYYPLGHIKNGQRTGVPLFTFSKKVGDFKAFHFYLQTESEQEAIAEVVRIQALLSGKAKNSEGDS